ncbi:MAG: PQQ-binding-like beta-propeller repeat protein, partial [Armatimonadetes bacterium]|nr:PQQ-binding-like beta-propeller repeat protein [Armatimonadota bacterium]
AWYYHDPEILWIARHARGNSYDPLGQRYYCGFDPRPPADQTGVQVARLPRPSYDHAARNPSYPTPPNLPWEECFDKLSLRAGLEREDEYLLLDGFGRGNHMHFDANAIIRYAAGGEPLLVDAEYIKNAPKYHNSMVIIRDGSAELTPAVTGLRYAEMLDSCGVTSTWLTDYNGTKWTRNILWLPGDYMVVTDEVEALEAGDYTLRCCWRPWGDATLEGNLLTVEHKPMRLTVANVGESVNSRLEYMRAVEKMPIWRLSQQVSRPMGVGDSYRFVNVISSEPLDAEPRVRVEGAQPRAFRVHVDGQPAVVVTRGDGALSPQGQVDIEADVALISEERIAAAGCTLLAGPEVLLKATEPVAIEISPAAGGGVLAATKSAEVQLRVRPGGAVTVDGRRVTADAEGLARLEVEAGRHELRFDPFAPPEQLASLWRIDRAEARGVATSHLPDADLAADWRQTGFEPAARVLPVESVTCDQEHSGRYGPVDKLADGEYRDSTVSVMWRPGVTPTIVMDLGREAAVRAVVTREWHMNTAWDVGERTLQVSSDGFVDDIRTPGPFEEAGVDSFGSNVNTLFKADVGQTARQIRLTISPARKNSSVYLAEVEIWGIAPGVVPDIRAVAAGDLTGDGTDEVVVCSDAGQVRALTADGTVVWSWQEDLAPLNAIACADVNDDGRAEVIFGGDGERLGLLSADGEELWRAKPPRFRGIASDVKTVLPADVDGDGVPEVVCGVKSWQYFAYDADGGMIWKNVIYAHSATVGWADDFDGDGRDEIVGGNEYYTLNLIDDDGRRMMHVGNLGPEQTAASSADVDGDGTPEILLGVDHGELRCYDTKRQVRWLANLGDRVTRIMPLVVDGRLRIICAAESANVFALDENGERVWRTPLPDGSTDLALAEVDGRTLICAAAGSAGVYVLDTGGRFVARGETGAPARNLVIAGDRVIVTTTEGTLEAFNLP